MTVADTKISLINEGQVVLGRLDSSSKVTNKHFVNGRPIVAPYTNEGDQPIQLEEIMFGLGCFWGAERKFWNTKGVYTTAVGYAGGTDSAPSYQSVCGGSTGHAEVVLVVFDPKSVSVEQLLQVFFESHDPTQGMRQGNDIGSQYRSCVYSASELHIKAAQQLLLDYQAELAKNGFGAITTEIRTVDRFYYAEDYHQQYLAKNPEGYCGIGGTGVSCAI